MVARITSRVERRGRVRLRPRLSLRARSLLIMLPLMGVGLLSERVVRHHLIETSAELTAYRYSARHALEMERFANALTRSTKELADRLLGDQTAVPIVRENAQIMAETLGRMARDPERQALHRAFAELAASHAAVARQLFSAAERGDLAAAHDELTRQRVHQARVLAEAEAIRDAELEKHRLRLDLLRRLHLGEPFGAVGLLGAGPSGFRAAHGGLQLSRYVLEELIAFDDAVERPDSADQRLANAAKHTDAALAQWVAAQPENETAWHPRERQLRGALREMRALARRAARTALRGDRSEATHVLEAQVETRFERHLQPLLAELAKQEASQAERKLTGFRSAAQAADLTAKALPAIVLLFAVAVPLYVTRSIVGPVRSLEQAAWRYSEGDPEARAREVGPPEIRALATAFNRMAAEAQQRSRQLEAARRAAEELTGVKSRLLAQMSHEIRTPMNGVLGMTELLLDTELQPEQRRYAETTYRSGQALLDLLNDILDLSKAEAGRLELEHLDFDPGQLVREVCDLMAKRVQDKGIALEREPDPEVPARVRGDPGRLRQILNNLVANAVRFTDEGEVVVSVAAVDETAQRPELRFEVRDTGIGIEPKAQARLFEPFSQAHTSTSRRYGGTGLGLAIAKQLVDLMGGEIGVESDPGRGSRFFFVVPLELASDPARGVAGQVDRAPQPRSLPQLGATVLLAEDNEVNRQVALAMLRKLGCSVTAVGDGGEAVDAFSHTSFDLVLMDCQMPVTDGCEATRAIRARETGRSGPPVPIVGITASRVEGERERCRAAGMDDLLGKPFTQEELAACLTRWLPAEGDPAAAAPPEPDPARAAPGRTSAPDAERGVPGRAPGAEPILDPQVLERIQALASGGDPVLLDRLIEAFLATAPGLTDSLRAALREDDPQTLARAAHALKSSSRNLGALRLGVLAERLETIGRSDSLKGADKIFVELEREWGDVRSALLELSGGGCHDNRND